MADIELTSLVYTKEEVESLMVVQATDLSEDIDLKADSVLIGAASGIAPLDADQKIDNTYLVERTGIVDYRDNTTIATPITLTTSPASLTNDGAGTGSVNMLPDGVTEVWNTTTNRFEFSELSIGDIVNIRADLSVTTSVVNQKVTLVLEIGSGSSLHDIVYIERFFKDIGTYELNSFNGIYIENENVRTNGGRFKMSSSHGATVTVHGWYSNVMKRG